MSRHLLAGTAMALVAGSACLSVTALAQTAEEQGGTTRSSARVDGEIVVTARSGAETLMTVPVAVTALGAEALQRYSSSSIEKIVQQVPQMTIYEGPASGPGGGFVIRGVGISGSDASLSQSVGVVIDGVQINKASIVYQGMYDLQQAEVLKGPQALFFGKNNPAGVISLKTREPGDAFEANATAGYEFEAKERYVEAGFGGPISDTLGIRVAGRYSKLKGWVKNISQSRPNPLDPLGTILPGANGRVAPGTEAYGGRVTLQFKPSGDFTSTLKVSAGVRNDNDALGTHEIVCIGKSVPALPNGMTDPHSDCELNRQKAATDLPPLYTTGTEFDPRWRSGIPYARLRSTLVLWNNTLDVGQFQIVSNSGYSRLRSSLRGATVNAEFASNTGGTTSRYHAYSQELRLLSDFSGPLNFTLGGYYEKSRNREDVDLFLSLLGADPVTGKYASSNEQSDIKAKTMSLFGQLRYDITDTLELAAGVRWTKEKKNTRQRNSYVHQAFSAAFSPPSRLLDTDLTFKNTSPEATITWRPDSDTTLYAAYKTGYKSGGTAVPAVLTLANTPETLTYGPEKVRGGEIGYKARLLDRRLHLELTAYYYKFKGLQLSSFDSVLSVFRTQNAANAKQKGIEGSLTYQVDDYLSLRGAFGLNSLKYGSFENSACYAFQTAAQGCVNRIQDLSGRRLHRAPKFSGSIGAGYERPIGGDLAAGLDFDALHTSSYFAGETQNPASFQKSHWILNSSARLMKEDGGWEIALIGRNLTNTNIIGFASDRAGGSAGEVNAGGIRGREIALQGTIRF